MSINATEGVYFCWRCGAAGRLTRSVAELLDVPFDEGLRYRAVREAESEEAIKRAAPAKSYPEGYIKLHPLSLSLSSLSLRRYAGYIVSRGLTPHDVLNYEVGVILDVPGYLCGNLVFPLLDPEVQGYTMRKVDRRGYRNSPGLLRGLALYNARVLSQIDEVFVVEGPLDAIRVGGAVATLGKDISEEQLSRLAAYDGDVVIAYDGDAWEFSRAVARRLRLRGKNNVSWVHLPPARDPGDIGPPVRALGRRE